MTGTALRAPETSPPRPSAGAARRRRPSWALAAVAAAALVGLGLRVFILTHSLGVLDSDEAVTGLMARHLLHHHEFHVFYWATNYGGTLEVVVTAVVFAVVGSSVTALKVTAVAWEVAGAVLVWRVGRRLFSERVGAAAACLLWVWPGVFVWWSTKSRGFYGALLVLGLATMLEALRVAEDPGRTADWLGLGALAGLGWWTGLQYVYLAVPAGAWILMRNRRALRRAWLAVPTALAGALPWIWWTVVHHGASLHSTFPRTESYVAHLHRFATETLPVAVGLRVPFDLRWTVAHGHSLFLLGAAVLGLGLAVAAWRGGTGVRSGVAALAVGLVGYPLLHALTPVASWSGEARYLFLYAPLVALAVAAAAGRSRAALAVAGALALTLSVGQLSTMHVGSSGSDSGRPVPVDIAPLRHALEVDGVRAVFAGYWIAYRIDFETGERVVATGVPEHRYPPYERSVRHDPHPAWVFVAGSPGDHRFAATLGRLGVAFRHESPGGFSLYLPARPVYPEESGLE